MVNPVFRDTFRFVFMMILCMFLVAGISWGGNALYKQYAIWSEGKGGETQYARAQANRKIIILEAEAQKESAKALADAEVIRAEGVARANLIIGDSLKSNESYLRYLWIQGLQTNNSQVVYVPTEANLPILEAHRLK